MLVRIVIQGVKTLLVPELSPEYLKTVFNRPMSKLELQMEVKDVQGCISNKNPTHKLVKICKTSEPW